MDVGAFSFALIAVGLVILAGVVYWMSVIYEAALEVREHYRRLNAESRPLAHPSQPTPES